MGPSDVVYVEKRRGPRPIPEETPVASIDVLWIPPHPSHLGRTYRWDRIQTSEVESQWYPAMRGWTGGSDGLTVSKAAERFEQNEGLMIWNRPLRLVGLQWLKSSAVSCWMALLKPDCLASSLLYCERKTVRAGWRQLVRGVFATNGKERDRSVVF